MRRSVRFLVILVVNGLVVLAFATAMRGSGRESNAPCKPGSDAAVIGGKRTCLKVGQSCIRALDRQYHRYAFHCHETARLTRKATTVKISPVVTDRPTVVFDWMRDRCGWEWDIPDLSARAFRDASGQVQLIASHYATRVMVGPDFDHLRRDCSVVLGSHFDPDPAAYDDHEWLASTWTPDGTTVYAFVHDEYQGNMHPGQCPSATYERCWWNTITFAASTDGGRTYSQSTPPALVANYPYRYVPDSGTFGAMMPSNIVHNSDGYYYALIYVKEQPPGVPNNNHLCLIRTNDVSDPSSWRAWSGGTAFSTSFIDPYRSTADPAQHLCRGVSPTALNDFPLGSLTYVTDAKQWLIVAMGGDGFYYSTSTDLITWTPKQRFLTATAGWTYKCGDPDPVHYPSIIDPASSSRNFDTTGNTAYLYYTQFHTGNCQQGPDRDLVRVPITISK